MRRNKVARDRNIPRHMGIKSTKYSTQRYSYCKKAITQDYKFLKQYWKKSTEFYLRRINTWNEFSCYNIMGLIMIYEVNHLTRFTWLEKAKIIQLCVRRASRNTKINFDLNSGICREGREISFLPLVFLTMEVYVAQSFFNVDHHIVFVYIQRVCMCYVICVVFEFT